MEETLVTFSLDDTSPCILYSPFRDTFSAPNLVGGWNPYFTTTGFAPAQNSTIVGVGTSLHITSLDGAALQIQWAGTGITLMGNATNASYSIAVDGELSLDLVTRDNVLADIQTLNDTNHTLQLTAHIPPDQNPPNSSMLVFDQAILFSLPIPVADNIGFQNQTLNEQYIAFLGSWSLIPDLQNPVFHTTRTKGDHATAAFNGTTFLLLGQTSPISGNYSVTLDNNTAVQFDARSSFTQADSLLFFATDLDPTFPHSVTVENVDGSDLSILVGGFKSIVPSPIPVPSPSTNTNNSTSTPSAASGTSAFPEGTIAAFALAGILAFIIISGMLFFFLVYRPRRRRRHRMWSKAYGRHRQGHSSPKAQEAGENADQGPVINIAPGAFPDDKSLEYVDDERQERQASPKEAQRKRWSALSGFHHWRRQAVRGSLGGLGLGIRFRHSDSAYARSVGHSNGNGDPSPDSARPSSAPTSLPSSTESARRARAKRKGKARHISGMSWTPSFTLDLTMPRISQRFGLGQGQSSGRAQRGSRSTQPLQLLQIQDRLDTVGAAPEGSHGHAYGPAAMGLEPPSYAASISNRGSTSPSSLIPSGPRSVSESSPAPYSTALGSPEAYARVSFPGDRAQEAVRAFILRDAGAESTTTGTGTSPPTQVGPVRPLPSPALYQQQQQQQQRTRAPTPAAVALSATQPTRDIGRKIVDPRFIDTLETADIGDNPSIEEPHIMRAVLRSLSPRTSRALPVPPPPRRAQPHTLVIPSGSGPVNAGTDAQEVDTESPESVTSPTRRLLPSPPEATSRWYTDAPPRTPAKPLPRTPTSEDEAQLLEVRDGVFLNVRETSPFRIDFADSTGTSLRALPPSRSDIAPSNVAVEEGGSIGGRGGGAGSSSGSISDPTFYTTAAESAYKPARNTFGVASTAQSHEPAGSRLERRPSSSDTHQPFRPAEFVQGSSRMPFRLAGTVSIQEALGHSESRGASAEHDPSPESSDGVVSFLDFTSSREGSLHVPSVKSEKKKRALPRLLPVPPEPRSRWSNTTVPSIATTAPEALPAPESSGESQKRGGSASVSPGRSTNSSTFPIPVRVNIPASPYHVMEASERAQSEGENAPSEHSSSNAQAADPLHVHPMLSSIESPTESLPISTSEIRFRHSDSDEGHLVRRAIPIDDSHRTQRSSMSDIPDSTEEYRPRPFDPSILVSRVLGLPSPTSSTTPRLPMHSRSQSNVLISSSRTSLFPDLSRHDSSNDQLTNRPAQS